MIATRGSMQLVGFVWFRRVLNSNLAHNLRNRTLGFFLTDEQAEHKVCEQDDCEIQREVRATLDADKSCDRVRGRRIQRDADHKRPKSCPQQKPIKTHLTLAILPGRARNRE